MTARQHLLPIEAGFPVPILLYDPTTNSNPCSFPLFLVLPKEVLLS